MTLFAIATLSTECFLGARRSARDILGGVGANPLGNPVWWEETVCPFYRCADWDSGRSPGYSRVLSSLSLGSQPLHALGGSGIHSDSYEDGLALDFVTPARQVGLWTPSLSI